MLSGAVLPKFDERRFTTLEFTSPERYWLGYLIKESDHDNETFENGPGWYILNDMVSSIGGSFVKVE